MKRNCNGCKALIQSVDGIGCDCGLGYQIMSVSECYGLAVTYKPLEECPKPKSFLAFCGCKRVNYSAKSS